MASGGELSQSVHYYPYGLPFAEGYKPGLQPYKYTAKELLTDRSLNLYDYGARLYIPDRIPQGTLPVHYARTNTHQ